MGLFVRLRASVLDWTLLSGELFLYFLMIFKILSVKAIDSLSQIILSVELVMWLLKHSNKIPSRLESLKNRDSQILEAEKLRVKSQFEFLNMIHSEDFIVKSIYDSMWEVPKSTYMNIEQGFVCPEVPVQSPLEEIDGIETYAYQANSQIQDTMCIFTIQDPHATCVSVFDGHGGAELSKFCAQNLKKYLVQSIELNQKSMSYSQNQIPLLKQSITTAYEKMQNEFYRTFLKVDEDNRTCALTLIIYEGKVIVANSGDSEAIIINDNSKGSYDYRKLNERLSTGNKNERQRLIKQFEGQSDIIVKQHTNSYYLKGMLQPTRTIGDYYLKKAEHFCGKGEFKGPYLSHEPQICVHQIELNDTRIILASDGLWDYLKKWEVVKEVVDDYEDDKLTTASSQNQLPNSKYQANSISRRLVSRILDKVADQTDNDVEFIKRIQFGERRQFHDDISICVVDLSKVIGATQAH